MELVGFFSKLFGKPEPEPEPAPEPEHPEAVIILRRGMKVPAADYLAQVLAEAYPDGLPEAVQRFGLSQPSWFKKEEIADSMAGDVASTFALKLQLAAYTHRRKLLTGPEGAPLMLVELFKS
jgi:hypothetical protein